MEGRVNKFKIIGYSVLCIALLLFVAGIIISIIGSESFNNYYVEPITINNFYSSMINYVKITMEYSKLFYVGIIFILLATTTFLGGILIFVYNFEFNVQKSKELEDILKVINPNNTITNSVKVGELYKETKNTKNKT